MDLDHVRGTKTGHVSTLIHQMNPDVIEREVAKCEPVCACCHRLRTEERRSGGAHIDLVRSAPSVRRGRVEFRLPVPPGTGRTCAKCHIEQDLSAFGWKNRERGWLQPWCRACAQSYKHSWHRSLTAGERNILMEAKIARIECSRAYVVRIKESTPCADCGELKPARAMDFDHLGDKTDNVSTLVQQGASMMRLLAEIAKCEIVCANCHRERTHNRSLLAAA